MFAERTYFTQAVAVAWQMVAPYSLRVCNLPPQAAFWCMLHINVTNFGGHVDWRVDAGKWHKKGQMQMFLGIQHHLLLVPYDDKVASWSNCWLSNWGCIRYARCLVQQLFVGALTQVNKALSRGAIKACLNSLLWTCTVLRLYSLPVHAQPGQGQRRERQAQNRCKE